MCQPGRPGPQGLSQLGSPSFAAFQRKKSRGSFFLVSSSTRAPGGDDFILDIGDVVDIGYIITAVGQPAPDDIEGHG